MAETFDLEIEISAGKKSFTIIPENDVFTLMESGSIVAILKQKEGEWQFTTGSYSEEDAKLIGRKIREIEKPS
ncbi:hypothetical protein [Desertivirga brevis]|uniref:hypothetical protein n=1 Tax=Desertivirga brevis TaxID=2810310 RepID=UPI001A959318|nr:hypothetical protein [Pedobacter sp. SYSU D00873]